ncbi:ABC transporter substrate-binding protein [Corynebacterium kroppenstedtii]|uniref:ABC transporter substrate-binding protein n=1 Tax=Corynebacterium sp. PCR 32 TaxID=3351342 RepID=UPI00309AEFDB
MTPHLTKPRATAITAALLTASLTTALTACGATIDTATDKEKITVRNCGIEHTYLRPERPVAYDASAIEKMFALGLADTMRGIVLPKTITSIKEKSPYRDSYNKVDTISDSVLSQETLVNAKADWISAGWQAGFSHERGITPDSLHTLGINSYMQEETCYNYGNNAKNPSASQPIEAMYQDLRNLGTIFNVDNRATTLIDNLKKREKTLKEKNHKHHTKKPKVFIYDSGTDQPYTAGKRTSLNSVVDLAGGTSVTANVDSLFTSVGWEPIVASQPEAVIVVDYNKQPVNDKITYLKTQSPIKDSPAITNNNIYVIDYAEAISSPRNLDAAEKLQRFLEEV